MTLESAATAALEALKELLPDVEEAERGFESAARHIEELCEQAPRDSALFTAMYEYARAQVTEQQGDKETKREARVAQLDEMREAVDEQAGEVKEAVEEAQEDLSALEEKVDEADERLDELVERLEEKTEALVERMEELDERFEAVVSRVETLIEDTAGSAVEELDEQVEELSQALLSTLEETALPRIESKVEEVVTTLGHLGDEVQDLLADAARRIQAEAERVIGACAETYQRAWQELREKGAEAGSGLEELASLADQATQELSDQRQRFEQAGEEAGEALGEAIEGINAALQFFGRFSFV